MANIVGLTDAKIQGLKLPASGQVEYPDKLIPGLRIRVGATGAKTFTLRKRIAGKQKNITLGRYSGRFKLADARAKARQLLLDIEIGKDPTVRSRDGRRSGSKGTVAELVEQYLAQEVRGKKRSASEIERTFKVYILPAIGSRMADSVTRTDVTQLVERVTFGGSRPTPRMGRAVHQQLSKFYSWAMPALDRLAANPCRDARRPAASVPRDRVLTDEELAALWGAAEHEGYPFGTVVQMLILTAQRRSEVVEAGWSEIDADKSIWIVPGERAKNGQPNIVPLSAAAREVLQRIPTIGGSKLIFPARSSPHRPTSGLTKAWERMVKMTAADLGQSLPRLTPHDIRRTAATGLQKLGVPLVVSEAVLNHQSGSRAGVAGVYHRHNFKEEKREALEAWGVEVQRIANCTGVPRTEYDLGASRRMHGIKDQERRMPHATSSAGMSV